MYIYIVSLGPWTVFSECDAECGGGMRSRINMHSEEEQLLPCNTHPCDTGAGESIVRGHE